MIVNGYYLSFYIITCCIGRRWARINLRKTVDGALRRAKCFVNRDRVVREHDDESAPKPPHKQRLCKCVIIIIITNNGIIIGYQDDVHIIINS